MKPCQAICFRFLAGPVSGKLIAFCLKWYVRLAVIALCRTCLLKWLTLSGKQKEKQGVAAMKG